ncbi:MAG: helix-turn-helix domain-containing protein [Burkholderiaceae bacterium]
MATSKELIKAIRQELRAADLTYADLAERLGNSESTVKRMFSRADMPLSRVDEILNLLGIDFNDLLRRMAQIQVAPLELRETQERALVSDRKLLLVAICCQSEWSFEQIKQSYLLSEAEIIKHFVKLDRLGVIELRAHNRYTLKLARGFRWRPHGPVMNFFRERAMTDYFSGGFDGNGETLVFTHGSISATAAPAFVERLQRIAHDFSRQHLADQALPDQYKVPCSLVLGMREWLFAEFAEFVREPA